MLSPEACRSRRERLWSLLPDWEDWLIIADPKHLTYLANYCASPFEFRSDNAAAVLILGRDGSSVLIADNLLQPYADTAVADEVVAPVWYRGRESAPDRGSFLFKQVLERLTHCQGRRFGIEPAHLPAGIVEGLRASGSQVSFTNITPTFLQMRRQKDADELAVLRLSMKAGEAGMAAGLRDVRPGMTEFDVFHLVQRAAQDAIGMQALVYGDFVTGPRCEHVGGPPTNRVINAGDLVLLDFSTVVWNYRADFANTFVCGGKSTARQTELYQACLEALQRGEKLLRAGVSARAVDQAVRSCLASAGLGQHHTGHIGHGIGLGHPEAPFIVPESSDTLLAGDVVTLEPGIYIPGVAGMRYERNYLITDDGYELLSHHELVIQISSAVDLIPWMSCSTFSISPRAFVTTAG